jgi:hypothetical protein
VLSQSKVWPDIPALDHEHQTDHGLLGQTVARNWLLSADIVLAVRHHHDLRQGGLPDPVSRLCALLNFACHLHNKRTGGNDSEWENGWKEETARRLSLNEDDLADWESEVENLSG